MYTLDKTNQESWVSAALYNLEMLKQYNVPRNEGDLPAQQVLFDIAQSYLLSWASDAKAYESANIPKPYIDLSDDGDICMVWRFGQDVRLDVDFDNRHAGQLTIEVLAGEIEYELQPSGVGRSLVMLSEKLR